MIVGLISPDSGEIFINELNIRKNHEKAMNQIGAIVENPDLYDYLSGLENIKLFSRIHNIKKDRITEIIKLVGLQDRINDKVKKYSLGMKQRLGLAVSLLHNPKLLILDEPTNGLDPEGIKELRDTLKNLAHKENMAIFVSSHLLNEMQLMCDKVAIINKGKIVKVDNLKNIQSNSETLYEFRVSNLDLAYEIISKITSCNKFQNRLIINYDKSISDILKILMENNIEVLSFNKKEISLEEQFLNITGGTK